MVRLNLLFSCSLPEMYRRWLYQGMRVVLLLCMGCLSVLGSRAWEKPGCHKLGKDLKPIFVELTYCIYNLDALNKISFMTRRYMEKLSFIDTLK